MKTVYTNFRIVDAERDVEGAVVVEDGLIKSIVTSRESSAFLAELAQADRFIDGAKLKDPASPEFPVLLPSFIDLHAHFRDPGFPLKETLESASLAAVKGGYTTLVCMANTSPVTDTLAATAALKARSNTLALIDLYPALSLTKNMEGRELSEIAGLAEAYQLEGGSLHSPPQRGPSPRNTPGRPGAGPFPIRILSEDGKDIADDGLFIKALRAAAQAGIPVSCHCDRDGENAATARVLRLTQETGARIHFAHVSTKEAVAMIAAAKQELPGRITAEATPHHLFLTRKRAEELGAGTFGNVAPPLRGEADREAVLEAVLDGTIDAIATDHAPHTDTDKEAGAPGFSGLETAFAVACTAIVTSGESDLCHLSSLMSASPARILGLEDRGTLAPGNRADFVIAHPETRRIVGKTTFRSRGKNTPFDGMELSGIILATIRGGKTVYEA